MCRAGTHPHLLSKNRAKNHKGTTPSNFAACVFLSRRRRYARPLINLFWCKRGRYAIQPAPVRIHPSPQRAVDTPAAHFSSPYPLLSVPLPNIQIPVSLAPPQCRATPAPPPRAPSRRRRKAGNKTGKHLRQLTNASGRRRNLRTGRVGDAKRPTATIQSVTLASYGPRHVGDSTPPSLAVKWRGGGFEREPPRHANLSAVIPVPPAELLRLLLHPLSNHGSSPRSKVTIKIVLPPLPISLCASADPPLLYRISISAIVHLLLPWASMLLPPHTVCHSCALRPGL
ncbi:unnamed protein product [Peniophora sp. CBMAI 1063]|nr:unnamed protein product [Peniophora sp. CBMAI 1063]